jgi:hypothetical protein
MLDRPAGEASRDLRLGCGLLRFEGLTDAAARTLDARWGEFVAPAGAGTPDLLARTVRGDGAVWLPPWQTGEAYRIEAEVSADGVFACSYHFAVASEGAGRFRMSVVETDTEPFGRVLDNIARYLVARVAAGRGGFAVHGAGVLRGGRGWIFAGPSGAGKSTAARHSAPAASLGDDFAVVLPAGAGFATCALPFDNREQAPPRAAEGLIPLAAIVRMFKAASHRIERPDRAVAEASLLACSAFRLQLADLEGAAGEAMSRLAASGSFLHLHAAMDPGFWPLLESAV